LRGRKLCWQLVAAALTELLGLFPIDSVSLGEDLARDLLVVARGVVRGVRVHLGAVDGDHARPDQARVSTQSEHVAEEAGERVLVALTKPRDGAVIRALV